MFKKLATLVCATAIATSAFTGIVANAALVRDQGINIVAERVDGADDQITLSVYAVGFDAIRNWGLNLAVTGGTLEAIDPEDFEPDEVALDNYMFNVDTDSNIFISTGTSTKSVSLDDNLIFTVTLSFTEDISNDITITLADESTLKKGDKKSLAYYESNDPEDNDLGFNDCVVSAGSSEPDYTFELDKSQAYQDVDSADSAVVGKFDLTVKANKSFALSSVKYNDNGNLREPQSITKDGKDASGTTLSAGDSGELDVILFVVINGTTETDALQNVVFE